MGTKDLCYSMNYISISFKHFDWTSWRLHIFRNFWFIKCWAKPFGGVESSPQKPYKMNYWNKRKSLWWVFLPKLHPAFCSVRYLGNKIFPRDKMPSFFLQVECRSPITLASLIWVSTPLDERCTTAVVMSIPMKTNLFTSGFLPLAAGGGFGDFSWGCDSKCLRVPKVLLNWEAWQVS